MSNAFVIVKVCLELITTLNPEFTVQLQPSKSEEELKAPLKTRDLLLFGAPFSYELPFHVVVDDPFTGTTAADDTHPEAFLAVTL